MQFSRAALPSKGEAAPIYSFLASAIQGQDLTQVSNDDIADLIVSPPSARAPGGSRFGDDTWFYPAEWYDHMPERAVLITFDFEGHDATGSILKNSIKRHLLSVTLFPLNARPDLSSLRQTAYMLKRIASWLAGEGYHRFSSMPRERLPELWEFLSRNWKAGSNWEILRKILQGMERQAERGFIEDVMPWADPFDWAASEGKVPSFHEDPSDFFDAPERPLADQTDTDGVWQPLSDGWLEAAGYRWTYLLKDILPNLVRLAEDWHDLNPRQPTRKRGWGGQPAGASLCKSYIADAKRTLREEYLHEFEWIDSNGDPIERLPFEIAGSRNLPVMWTDLLRLISCTQRSLYCLLLLLTAGRRSEVSSLKRSSLLVEVIEDDTGYSHLHGRSYKLSGFGIGDETAWPIPASVGPYVESWRAFVGLLMGEQSKSFWISMSVRGAGGRPSIEPWPQELSLKLGLDDLAGDGNVHAHRFRKSMARLAVLCLVGAPLILQQILGHDGLATTLKYIFSDPHIREELREILEEIRLDIAITVAEGVDEAGGRGANTIRRARDEFLDKLEIPQNERAQRYAARDFAVAHLAQGGFDLKVVFAGIICIKPPEVPGRCSQFGLKPDFSRCQADCLHFLALPSARASTQITLEWLLAELEDPEIASSELLAPFYRAQFIDQARIFENLRLTYASDPRVCSLFPEAAQRLLSKSAQS